MLLFIFLTQQTSNKNVYRCLVQILIKQIENIMEKNKYSCLTNVKVSYEVETK